MRALLLLLLASAPLLSGCVGTAQATAMDERNQADSHAAAWDANAELAAVVGFEGQGWNTWGATAWPETFGPGDGGAYSQRAGDDPNVGDGRCELWVYRYVAANKPTQVYEVVVDRDGEVIHSGVEPRDSDDVPLGRWEIDSDQAMDIAMDANDGLARGTDSEHFGLILALGRDDENPNAVWFIAGGGGDQTGGGGGMTVVDAVTGDVVATFGGFGPSDWAGWGGYA